MVTNYAGSYGATAWALIHHTDVMGKLEHTSRVRCDDAGQPQLGVEPPAHQGTSCEWVFRETACDVKFWRKELEEPALVVKARAAKIPVGANGGDDEGHMSRSVSQRRGLGAPVLTEQAWCHVQMVCCKEDVWHESTRTSGAVADAWVLAGRWQNFLLQNSFVTAETEPKLLGFPEDVFRASGLLMFMLEECDDHMSLLVSVGTVENQYRQSFWPVWTLFPSSRVAGASCLCAAFCPCGVANRASFTCKTDFFFFRGAMAPTLLPVRPGPHLTNVGLL